MSAFIENNEALLLLLSLAAGAVALAACGYLLLALRRYRRDQKTVMGESRDRDLVAHARAVEQRVDGLAGDIRNLAGMIEQSEKRLADCLTFRSVIRYDAYRDLSGMQSTSMALLDTRFSGVIVSSIQSRDHSRIYVKEIRHGESREKLSPEEVHVLKEAMGLKDRQDRQIGQAAGGEGGG